MIGPAGGTVEIGVHRLVIPAGALSEPVAITGELTAGPLVAVDFSPQGLTFAKPVLLQIAYSHCRQVAFDGRGGGNGGGSDGGGSGVRHGVAYVDSDESVLERLQSTDDGNGAVVQTWITHFSRYAITY